ncbi:glycoside hydrolase family 3 C-terminal domain-containing protein [Bauldia sp.]|uniref:glycoside hydrolase family 3 C-terminal domain-containing protein n=1 Tax=Bauldia sp. TaxID=2575872 RepID=UPI003BAADEBB
MAHASEPTPEAAAAFDAFDVAQPLTVDHVEARVEALLAELTLDEKLGLMDGDLTFWKGLAKMSAPGGYSSQAWVAGAVARLGIPGIRFSDGPRGVVMAGGTTFPVTMARGATFDPDLEARVGDAIGRELRAIGANLFGGVCINLLRHPAWGRAQETYGEDSYHLGVMGAALATGVQNHAMACVKHYALNSMENARQTVDVSADERALHEVYLPHFKRVVDAGVAAVMSAYNTVNGEQAGQNKTLLTDILKQEWGFDGYVLTDFITGMRDAKTAALAGQDLEMPFATIYRQHLKALVESGDVPLARIDDAARRLLRQQLRLGADTATAADYPRAVIGCEDHRRLSREVAQKAIVLLKNDGDLLPLTDVGSIAVIGHLADTPNTGDGGSSNTNSAYVVTPLEGVRAAVGEGMTVFHDDGQDRDAAAAQAANADVALVVVGYTHADEGEYIPPGMLKPFRDLFPAPESDEVAIADRVLNMDEGGFSPGGDRLSLTLHPDDEALIQAVAAANPKTVVAIMAGSAVITEAWRDSVPAILMLWYPGMEGGNALADVLLGRVNPSGRLPCTFPQRADDLPFFDRDAKAITYDLWHGYRKLDRDGAAAAFPFGFGLSYTDFALSNLRLEESTVAADGAVKATVDVTNTGNVVGDEVVQLYVSASGSAVERAPKELKAFARVSLEPGETRAVTLSVPVADLAYRNDGRWVVEPIEYVAIAARHAEDGDALSEPFRVT